MEGAVTQVKIGKFELFNPCPEYTEYVMGHLRGYFAYQGRDRYEVRLAVKVYGKLGELLAEERKEYVIPSTALPAAEGALPFRMDIDLVEKGAPGMPAIPRVEWDDVRYALASATIEPSRGTGGAADAAWFKHPIDKVLYILAGRLPGE